MARRFPPILASLTLFLTLASALLARPAASCIETPSGDFDPGPPMLIGATSPGGYSVAGADCTISVIGSVHVGLMAGGVGTFTITDAATFSAKLLYLGVSGVGTTTFDGGAQVTTNTTLTLGAGDLSNPSAPAARGDLVVDGPGTLVQVGTGVAVALREPAQLVVSGGARIQAQQGLNISGLSGTPGGDGEVIIRGAGSTIQTALGLNSTSRVGYQGTGSLTVDQGGRLEAYALEVAPGGMGTVVVDSGGEIVTGVLRIAGGDAPHTANFSILGGGRVEAALLSVGTVDQADVTFTIHGAGSELVSTSIIAINHVGKNGRSILRIENGGSARFAGDLYLGQTGRGLSQYGWIEVTGADSELVADEIRLSDTTASSGDGLLVIDGGTVTATQIRVLGMLYGDGEIRGSGLIVGDLSVERGWLKVGNPIGQLQVDGNTTMAWKLELEIAGPGALEYDQLDVTGDLDITGVVYLDFINGYQPDTGDVFDVITSGGTFNYAPASTTITGLVLPPGANLVTNILPDRVRLSVVPEPAALLSHTAALGSLLALRRRRGGATRPS